MPSVGLQWQRRNSNRDANGFSRLPPPPPTPLDRPPEPPTPPARSTESSELPPEPPSPSRGRLWRERMADALTPDTSLLPISPRHSSLPEVPCVAPVVPPEPAKPQDVVLLDFCTSPEPPVVPQPPASVPAPVPAPAAAAQLPAVPPSVARLVRAGGDPDEGFETQSESASQRDSLCSVEIEAPPPTVKPLTPPPAAPAHPSSPHPSLPGPPLDVNMNLEEALGSCEEAVRSSMETVVDVPKSPTPPAKTPAIANKQRKVPTGLEFDRSSRLRQAAKKQRPSTAPTLRGTTASPSNATRGASVRQRQGTPSSIASTPTRATAPSTPRAVKARAASGPIPAAAAAAKLRASSMRVGPTSKGSTAKPAPVPPSTPEEAPANPLPGTARMSPRTSLRVPSAPPSAARSTTTSRIAPSAHQPRRVTGNTAKPPPVLPVRKQSLPKGPGSSAAPAQKTATTAARTTALRRTNSARPTAPTDANGNRSTMLATKAAPAKAPPPPARVASLRASNGPQSRLPQAARTAGPGTEAPKHHRFQAAELRSRLVTTSTARPRSPAGATKSPRLVKTALTSSVKRTSSDRL